MLFHPASLREGSFLHAVRFGHLSKLHELRHSSLTRSEIHRPIVCHHPTDWNALMFASHQGTLELVQILVEAFGMLRLDEEHAATSLWLAASRGHLDVVRYLHRECGVSLRGSQTTTLAAVRPVRESLLYIACRNGHLSLVKYLMAFILETPTTSPIDDELCQRSRVMGDTPLLAACRIGNFSVVEYLAEECPEHILQILEDQRDWMGNTPLLLASLNGHLELVQYLLEKVSGTSKQSNHSGSTPLMAAAKGGHLKVVELLLNHHHHFGASDILVTNQRGESALSLAQQHRHTRIVDMLTDRCAQLRVRSGRRRSSRKEQTHRRQSSRSFPAHLFREDIPLHDEYGSTRNSRFQYDAHHCVPTAIQRLPKALLATPLLADVAPLRRSSTIPVRNHSSTYGKMKAIVGTSGRSGEEVGPDLFPREAAPGMRRLANLSAE